MYRDQRFPQKV